MNSIRKKLAYRYLIYFISSSLGTFSYYEYRTKDAQTLVKTSSDIRNSLYETILDKKIYFNDIGEKMYFVDGKTEIQDGYEDRNLTKENLSKVKELKIDLRCNENLEILKIIQNLEVLNIENAQLLSDYDIVLLNNLKVKNINLSFNLREVNKNRENSFDLKKFKDKNVKVHIEERDSYSEVDYVIFINYLKNYSVDNIIEVENYLKYKKIDVILNKIVESLKIKDNTSMDEKILTISNYIINKIQYQKELTDELAEYYNEKTLSSILINQDKEIVNGICINYASLFDILSYKTNIKSRMISGIEEKSQLGHAWNVIYDGDEKKYLDLTFDDKDLILRSWLFNYYVNSDIVSIEEIINNIKEKMYEKIDDSHANFSLFTEIDELDKLNDKKIVSYYNIDLHNKKIIKKKLTKEQLILLLLELFSLITLLGETSKEQIKTKKLSIDKNKKYC